MKNSIAIYTEESSCIDDCDQIAERLNINYVLESDLDKFDVVILVEKERMGLWRPQQNEKPVYLDFNDRSYQSRISRSNPLHKVIQSRHKLDILDLTAGFGHDAYCFAGFGNSVLMCERSPIIATLLEYALKNFKNPAHIRNKLSLYQGDSRQLLLEYINSGKKVDLVYIDTMFPVGENSALVKKDMRILRDVVGDDPEDDLLNSALKVARKKVVIKRMKKSSFYGDQSPDEQIRGKSNRYDIYFSS